MGRVGDIEKHAKLIVLDVKKSLVSLANLSYHGMQGNVEMGLKVFVL